MKNTDKIMDALDIAVESIVADAGGSPGPPLEERVDATQVIRAVEAAGLTLLSDATFLTYQFLLVFVPSQRAPGTAEKTAR